MAWLEYPKHVYRDGDVTTEDSVVVRDAAEEAAQAERGYRALATLRAPSDAPEASPTFLDYPRHLYRDGDVEKESVRVENAEEEASATAHGYLRLGAVSPETEAEEVFDGDDPEPPSDESGEAPRRRRGRPRKG